MDRHGVPAVADPVGPRHEQLTTPGRALGVLRVSGEHVATAKGVGAKAAPHLDDDRLVLYDLDRACDNWRAWDLVGVAATPHWIQKTVRVRSRA